MPDKPYRVVWSGVERRRYLGVDSHPLAEPEPRQERRQAPRAQTEVSERWLAGAHYREDDTPQQRLFYSVLYANAPFTVPELALAAKVSRTLARRHIEWAITGKRARAAGSRPVGRTRVLVFEAIPSKGRASLAGRASSRASRPSAGRHP